MRYAIAIFIGAVLVCAGEAAAHPHDQPQAQQYIIMRQPCIFRPFARARYNRMFVPRAVRVPVQPLRWIPGRWAPVDDARTPQR